MRFLQRVFGLGDYRRLALHRPASTPEFTRAQTRAATETKEQELIKIYAAGKMQTTGIRCASAGSDEIHESGRLTNFKSLSRQDYR